jgi:hypothetical protein
MLLADPDKTKRHGAGLLTAHSMPIEPKEVVDEQRLIAPVLQPVVDAVNGIPTLNTEHSVQHKDQDQDQFSELFAGIFDDTAELDDESAKAELEAVTTEDDDDEARSDADFWF